jgi:hypothetical protein
VVCQLPTEPGIHRSLEPCPEWDSNPQTPDFKSSRSASWRTRASFRTGLNPDGSVSSGGWNRTSGLRVQSAVSLPAATAPELDFRFPISDYKSAILDLESGNCNLQSAIRGGGFEPPRSGSKPESLPVSRSPRAPRGSRTRLSGLEDRCLCRSARGA